MFASASAVLPADDPEGPMEVTAFDGRRMRVDYDETPVIDLGRRVMAGRLLEPRLTFCEDGEALTSEDRATLLASDMERIDMLTLNRANALMAERGGEGAMILAISFLTATSQRARTRLLAGSPAAIAERQASVIWLLTDLPAGAPAGRVTEVVSLLKPFGRAVFARTRPNGSVLKTARRAGIAGLVIEPQKPFAHSIDCALWMLQVGKVAARAAPTLIAAGLPSCELYGMAGEAGFTHATVNRPGEAVAIS